jgi:hypothetical protein
MTTPCFSLEVNRWARKNDTQQGEDRAPREVASVSHNYHAAFFVKRVQ